MEGFCRPLVNIRRMLNLHPYSQFMNQNPLGAGSVGQTAQSLSPSLSNLNAVPRRPEWDTAILETIMGGMAVWRLFLLGVSFLAERPLRWSALNLLGRPGCAEEAESAAGSTTLKGKRGDGEGERWRSLFFPPNWVTLIIVSIVESSGYLGLSHNHLTIMEAKTGMRVGQAVCISTPESTHAYVFSTLAPGRTPLSASTHLHLFCEDDFGKYVGGRVLRGHLATEALA